MKHERLMGIAEFLMRPPLLALCLCRAARGPQLRMLDRPVNQDGCQGATVPLSYAGRATIP